MCTSDPGAILVCKGPQSLAPHQRAASRAILFPLRECTRRQNHSDLSWVRNGGADSDSHISACEGEPTYKISQASRRGALAEPRSPIGMEPPSACMSYNIATTSLLV